MKFLIGYMLLNGLCLFVFVVGSLIKYVIELTIETTPKLIGKIKKLLIRIKQKLN